MRTVHIALKMPTRVVLAAYILGQAQEYVEGCGGSHVAVLRLGKGRGSVNATRIEEFTKLLQVVHRDLVRHFLQLSRTGRRM
jgi:hypothetical protein